VSGIAFPQAAIQGKTPSLVRQPLAGNFALLTSVFQAATQAKTACLREASSQLPGDFTASFLVTTPISLGVRICARSHAWRPGLYGTIQRPSEDAAMVHLSDSLST
jgi:hypothetical protein